MTHKTRNLIAASLAASVFSTHAASDLTNSLQTYLGNSEEAGGSNQPTFLADSGLEVSFIWPAGDNAWEKIDFLDSTAVLPDLPGARFGANTGGGKTAGRNYIRTTDIDYHTTNVTAFVTVNRAEANDSVFFGMGTGSLGGSKAPDRGTNNASVFVELQDGFPNASIRVTGDSINSEKSFTNMRNSLDEEQLVSSALRIRMEYNAALATVTYTLDYEFNGTFEEEQILPAASITDQSGEWLGGDRASVFFGGDSGVIFTDLEITTTTATAPLPPSSLMVSSFGDSTVSLSWSDIISDNTYSVYRSETSGDYGDPAIPIASGLTSATYTDNTVVNDTTYFYVVTQSDSVPTESVFSSEVSVTPTAVLDPPANLLGFNGGEDTIYLNWDDLIAEFDSYSVYRSEDGTTFTEIASGLTSSEYLDTTALSITAWDYYVVAVKGGTESDPSNLLEVQESSAIEVFVDFNASGSATNSGLGAYMDAAGGSWVGLNQNSAATSGLSSTLGNPTRVGITGLSPAGGNRPNGYGVGGNHTPLDDGSQTLVDGYSLMRDYHWRNNSTWSYTISGLIPGRPYDLYLFGYGDNNGQNTAFEVGGQLKQTGNPQGLTELTEGKHYVTFTAVPNANGEFVITWGSLSQFPALVDADAASGFAAMNGFQLVENSAAVLQPANLAASNGDNSVSINWDDVDGAISYKVYRSLTLGSGHTLLGTSSTSDYVDNTAANGTTYYYVVTADDGSNESFTSSEAIGTPGTGATDTDDDKLSDADELLIGTDPEDPESFFVTTGNTIDTSGSDYNISFVINGAEGKDYWIERSSTLGAAPDAWSEIPGTRVSWTWTTGVLDDLNLSTTILSGDVLDADFFRVVGEDTP